MADSEPTNSDVQFVDANTDDLDAFNDLLSGKAQVKQDDPVEAAPKNEEVTTDDDDVENVGEEEVSDEEATDEDDSPDGEEEPKPEAKPKKKANTFQERINELTARAREAERREAEALRRIQEAEDKQSKPAAPTPNTPVQTVDDSPKPDETNDDGSDKYPLGEFDPAYIRDLTRHTIQKETAAANERAEQERVNRQNQEAREALHSQWTERLSEVQTKHEDYLDKTMELETAFDGLDANYSDYLVQTIKSLDHGPEVLYHFANNLEEAKKFVKLGPLAATLALGEINAKFKSEGKTEQTKPEPKVSKAPTPPPAVKGSKTRTTVTGDTDDLDAFSKMLFAKKR